MTNPAHPEGGSSWIPVRIVNVVYNFVSFPKGYEDPLDSSQEFGAKERNRLAQLGYDGVSEYLMFRKSFVAIGSKIAEKKDLKSRVTKPDYIDSVVVSNMFGIYDEE